MVLIWLMTYKSNFTDGAMAPSTHSHTSEDPTNPIPHTTAVSKYCHLGVNMGSNSIPPKTLSDESINRGLVCAHMHLIARTQKILTFMS